MRGGDPSSWQATGRPPLLTALIILAWQCPPYPQKRTLLERVCGATKIPLLDHLVSGDEQSLRHHAAPRRILVRRWKKAALERSGHRGKFSLRSLPAAGLRTQ